MVYLLFPGNQGSLFIIPWKPGRFINYSLETRAAMGSGPCLFGTLPIRQSNLEDLVHETPVSWIQGQVDWLQLFSLQLVTVTFILIEILKHSA